MKIVNKRFWRLDPGDGTEAATMIQSPFLQAPAELLAKLRRLDGILIATWDPDAEQGRVHALGIVREVQQGRSAVVDWRPANFTLHPSGQGGVKWKKMPFFRFADTVAVRYGLVDHFTDSFLASDVDSRVRERPVDESAIPALRDPTFDEVQPVKVATYIPEDHVPQSNRVAPNGEIFATPERGLFTGNRTSPPRWLVCDLHFKRNLKEPRKYTKLFFLDEAVALAAGHRPCNTCRRDRYEAYLSAVRAEKGIRGAADLDALLNGARRAASLHAPIASLPDGSFIALGDGDYRLKWRGALYRWTPAGYVDAVTLADLELNKSTVLTPELSLAALRSGYSPVVHPSATYASSDH